jgi:hypothetical protein
MEFDARFRRTDHETVVHSGDARLHHHGYTCLCRSSGRRLGADRSSLSPEQIAARSRTPRGEHELFATAFSRGSAVPARIFEPSIWRAIQSAAREYDLEPMMLAGMIFIESYGDPLAKSPTGPAGIAQLTKGSARELGLSTGRKVRIGTKSVKKTRWVGTGKNRRKVVQTVKQPVYKTLDERYVPERASWRWPAG